MHLLHCSPPFHEARTQPELAVMIREGRIPDLPKLYTAHLGQVVKAMLKQNVSYFWIPVFSLMTQAYLR